MTDSPRSSEAFISLTRLFIKSGPNSSRQSARIVDVLPVPGGPNNNRWGRFAACTIRLKVSVACSWLLTSSSVFGRYFSTHGTSAGATTIGSLGFDFELEAAAARALLSKKFAMIGRCGSIWCQKARRSESLTAKPLGVVVYSEFLGSKEGLVAKQILGGPRTGSEV